MPSHRGTIPISRKSTCPRPKAKKMFFTPMFSDAPTATDSAGKQQVHSSQTWTQPIAVIITAGKQQKHRVAQTHITGAEFPLMKVKCVTMLSIVSTGSLLLQKHPDLHITFSTHKETRLFGTRDHTKNHNQCLQ